MRETSIHQHFNQLDDPRLDRRKKYPIINLIYIAFCAVLCGAEDWVSITRFGKSRFNGLSQFLDLTNGIPSQDTFNREFAILDTSVFVECFIGWAAHLAENTKKTVAIDGKSLRATKNKVSNLGPVHIVNALFCKPLRRYAAIDNGYCWPRMLDPIMCTVSFTPYYSQNK